MDLFKGTSKKIRLFKINKSLLMRNFQNAGPTLPMAVSDLLWPILLSGEWGPLKAVTHEAALERQDVQFRNRHAPYFPWASHTRVASLLDFPSNLQASRDSWLHLRSGALSLSGMSHGCSQGPLGYGDSLGVGQWWQGGQQNDARSGSQRV
jgi:hypothetical protein